MKKPTVEQVAWVFRHLREHLKEQPASFRYLIYERMGFKHNAYAPLYKAGGQDISNAFFYAAGEPEVESSVRENAD